MNLKLAFLEVKLSYYKSKPITELTDEEIQEFLQLRQDYRRMQEQAKKAWENLRKALPDLRNWHK